MVHLASQPAESSWTVVIGLVGTPFEIQKEAFWAKKGTFGALGRNKKPPYQVKVCGNHESNPVTPSNGSWAEIRPPRAAQGPPGPPKGLFGPNRALLGPRGYQKGPRVGQ